MSGIDPNASLVVSGIKNDLLILGNLQRFLFNFDVSGVGLQSQFTPTSAMSANLFCEFENTNQRGYRFKHTTDTTNALGVFKLVSFTKQPSLVETDIFTCDQNTIHFSLSPNVPDPTTDLNIANKRFVDNHTWLTSQITNFDATVRTYRLNDFLAPSASLNFGGFNLLNLANPVNAQDATTKSYVDTLQKSVSLSRAISGAGMTGSSISTSFNLTLNQITSPTTSLNLNSQKIINLGTPTLSTAASTKGYVDSKTWTASQITDFDSQVRLSRLDQMATPTTSLNLNSQKIINLATPTLSTDAVTKNYADTSTVSPSRLTGYTSSSASFLRGDGTWASVSGGTVSSVGIIGGTGISVTGTPITISGNITLSLSGIPIGSLSGYPSSVNSVLRGDGTWGAPNFVNIASLAGYPSNSSVFLRGDGAWATPSGGSTSLSSNSINVNTDGGNTNWLRRSINTTTGTQVFGLTSASYILGSNNGESAGIGFDGGSDTCTIWTAGDGGTLLNIQDEDSSNARLAYVATNGAWTQVSSEKRKHSIREKANNNVLERFLSLSVKSYGYHYPIEDTLPETKKKRIERKTNKMSMGFVLEDMFKVFPNCLPDYYNALFQDAHNKELSLEKEIKDPENSGIDYTTLLCYFVMAFQEYVEKTNKVLLDLKEKMKVLEGGGHA